MEFEVKNLGYSEIEQKICNGYSLGYPSSSNFTELEIGKTKSIKICTSKGNITCDVSANKKVNSDMYVVSCGCVKLSKKK